MHSALGPSPLYYLTERTRPRHFVPRRDGLVLQAIGANDYYGFGDDTTVPDRAEAERAVRTIASLYG